MQPYAACTHAVKLSFIDCIFVHADSGAVVHAIQLKNARDLLQVAVMRSAFVVVSHTHEV
jgi:hypothetical protein